MPKRKRGVYETISSSPNMLVNIPHDVVVDQILEKLPVKSLLRFRAVSKQWRTEIESPRFQERHLRHQQKSRDPSILICHPRLEKRGKASLRLLSVGATLVSKRTIFVTLSLRKGKLTWELHGVVMVWLAYIQAPSYMWSIPQLDGTVNSRRRDFKHLLSLHITAFDALSWDSVKTISQGCTRLFGCTTLIVYT